MSFLSLLSILSAPSQPYVQRQEVERDVQKQEVDFATKVTMAGSTIEAARLGYDIYKDIKNSNATKRKNSSELE